MLSNKKKNNQIELQLAINNNSNYIYINDKKCDQIKKQLVIDNECDYMFDNNRE